MNHDDAEEYTQGLGQAVAGSWRLIALGEKLGVPKALGLTINDWVEQRLGGYVRLSISERREAVAELMNGNEALSGRQVAEVLGVTHTTVQRDLAGTNVPPMTDDQDQPELNGTNVPPPIDKVRKGPTAEELRQEVDFAAPAPPPRRDRHRLVTNLLLNLDLVKTTTSADIHDADRTELLELVEPWITALSRLRKDLE